VTAARPSLANETFQPHDDRSREPPSFFTEVQAMLVLSRKPGQRITIGERITVTVLEVRGSCIRLGIEAPREVPVHREELWADLTQGGSASAATSPLAACDLPHPVI